MVKCFTQAVNARKGTEALEEPKMAFVSFVKKKIKRQERQRKHAVTAGLFFMEDTDIKLALTIAQKRLNQKEELII